MPDSRDSLVNSLVGPGSAIDGDIDVEGMLRVDGDVRGSVRVTGKIVVGSGGRVEASIRARSAIVGGLVKGDVYVSEQLRLLSGGVIVGNVYAPRLEVEDDTLINGFVEVNGEEEKAESGLENFVSKLGGSEAAERFLGGFRASGFAPREAERPAGSGYAPAASATQATQATQATTAMSAAPDSGRASPVPLATSPGSPAAPADTPEAPDPGSAKSGA